MPNEKTYRVSFSITAIDKDEAIIKAKKFIDENSDKVIKEIWDKEKYKILKI